MNPKPIEVVGPDRAPSNNREFLEFIFDTGSWVWGCSFSSDPHGVDAKFKGRFAQLPAMPIKDNAHLCNTYFCVSQIREKGGQRQRQESFFDGLMVLVIDDVGEKGRSLEEICRVLTPTYVIHTSDKLVGERTVASYQVGYVFKEPVTDPDTAKLLLKWIAAKEGDKSGHNLVRVVRLPYGMNTAGSEPAQGQLKRQPNKVRLHDWSGVKYSAEDLTDAYGIKELPDNVAPLSVTAFGKTVANRNGPGRGNEEVNESDVYRKLSLDEIEEALSFIDPGQLPYDGNDPDHEDSAPHWLGILMAIHSQYPGADGKAVADEWSKRGGGKYVPGEVDKRWGGFGNKQGFTIATLIKFAREAGWHPKKGLTERDQLLAQWGAPYAVVQVGNKVRILEENVSGRHTPEQSPYNLPTVEDFKKWTHTQRFVDPQDSKEKRYADAWFNWPYRRQYRGIGCYPPGAGPPPTGYYNSWRGFAVEPIPGDCSLWHRHVRDVYCDGNHEHYEWVLKWLAALVQYPGKPVGTALACRGEEGTGKNAFWHPFIKIFGYHCVQFTDQQHMETQFTGILEGKVLVLNNEAYWGGNSKTAGKLKGLITEPYVVSERKGIEACTVFNPLWFGFMSNSEYFIPADKSSRRFMATEISDCHKQDSEYFIALFDQMNSGGTEALLYELLSMELSEEDLRNTLKNPPTTKALLKQGNRTHEDFASWVQQLALEGNIPHRSGEGATYFFYPSKQAFDDFVTFRKAAGLYPATVGHAGFGKLVRALGVTQAKPRIDGSQMRCYKLPPLGEFRRRVVETYPCDELEEVDADEEWRVPGEGFTNEV
ncbi:DUF5906 domain-containing protein [Chromatocurvus halotolerans]|uniref:Primase-like protein n=1 Tax=Chromatocurvus halotolerans TaxID=1132028 RepID=A0A4R2KVZ4_9GAMM|nr:DUF5906 domain-containing protein [Chromatocurvus halotolerans]TCO77152.1 primase-like protein [Chromatocurvus halotolerans]